MNFDSQILNKDHLKIIITDSGLGGLSVQAILDKELRKRKIKPHVELIFYNSLASHNYGYNTMSDEEEKIRVFDLALEGMLKFKPDLILIACNTLSVIYPKTNFSKKYDIPILGIIESGIDLIIQNINYDKDYAVMLFGTETTISSKIHLDKLIEKGLNPSNIFSQSCKDLESEIQIAPTSKNVKHLLTKYINEIRNNCIMNKNKYAVFCCTHYGYSEKLFQEVLNEIFGSEVTILNPNKYVAHSIASGFSENSNSEPRIKNFVYSKVDISKKEINLLGSLLAIDSSQTAEAFKNYQNDTELFKY